MNNYRCTLGDAMKLFDDGDHVRSLWIVRDGGRFLAADDIEIDEVEFAGCWVNGTWYDKSTLVLIDVNMPERVRLGPPRMSRYTQQEIADYFADILGLYDA